MALRAHRMRGLRWMNRLILCLGVMGWLGPVDGAADGNLNPVWEATFQQRTQWWSLRPILAQEVPRVDDPTWARNEVDRFVLAGLEKRGLKPTLEADRYSLARRLSFALTGLPPRPETLARFIADRSPLAFEDYARATLSDPHFGERWARHWMDVVHYADTHGYEWDTPAKNGWMYRDYLIRALNSDVPYNRFVLEHLAGDLVEPRIDRVTGLNESLIGPMALRLGERRHGDNAADEGVTQEAVANMIDTVGRGFLATTLACAQCHDHKLDAVSQQDYYALAGVFMSSRWHVRGVEALDPNEGLIDRLRDQKQVITKELARVWRGSRDGVLMKIRSTPIPQDKRSVEGMPETLVGFWGRSMTNAVTREAFLRERERRIGENRLHLKELADFTREDGAPGWRWDGLGMRHGLVRDGEIVVAEEGGVVVQQILPAGRWSHRWSMRLAGAVRSPLLDSVRAATLSVHYAAGKHAAQSMIVDHAFHSERMQFLNQREPGLLTLKTGDFDTLEGGRDKAVRRVYLELVTKSLNNYFPPRTGYGGMKEEDANDEASWFGVTRVWEHPPGKPPLDELGRFAPLFDGDTIAASGVAERFAELVMDAVERWSRDEGDADTARLLGEALSLGWLPNDIHLSAELEGAVSAYRGLQRRLVTDRTVGSAEDWAEAQNERVGVRGSYTEFGHVVNRGNPRVLDLGDRWRVTGGGAGRLELARSLVDPSNPLTARVIVNRVWLYLFGEGLVRTPDDFGHLGEAPTHPELLDYLATRFVAEGWSIKRLILFLVSSSTWRQGSGAALAAVEVDPENRFWHHMPLRRLEAEAIRDSILSVAGGLDERMYGVPVDPYRAAEDPAKRLMSGPLDGLGRRSIYLKQTLMEPPRFLALFNQPLPKMTQGRRDVTQVPDQALALLNDPFVVTMARRWSERLMRDPSTDPEQRVRQMFRTGFAREPSRQEVARCVGLVERSARLHGASKESLMRCQPAWQDLAHAVFNLKEFIYVR